MYVFTKFVFFYTDWRKQDFWIATARNNHSHRNIHSRINLHQVIENASSEMRMSRLANKGKYIRLQSYNTCVVGLSNVSSLSLLDCSSGSPPSVYFSTLAANSGFPGIYCVRQNDHTLFPREKFSAWNVGNIMYYLARERKVSWRRATVFPQLPSIPCSLGKAVLAWCYPLCRATTIKTR